MALKVAGSALAAIDRAIGIEPDNIKFLMHRAQCLLALNRRRDALDAAEVVERRAPNDPAIWGALGTVHSYANDQVRACAAYDRAVALAPQDPQFIYNRASVRRFLGAVNIWPVGPISTSSPMYMKPVTFDTRAACCRL